MNDEDLNNEWGDIGDDLKTEPLFVPLVDGGERYGILWIHVSGDRAWYQATIQ